MGAGRTRPARAAPTPEELALRVQRGGSGAKEAFGRLVGVFEERLYNFLLRRGAAASDAEDLTQETFIRAWQRIGQYNPRWRFSTWLFTIGARLTAGRYRDRPAPPLRLVTDEPLKRTAPDRLATGEERVRVWALVEEAVSPEQHTALWLRYAEDMAIADIARVLGKSQVGVRVMLFRARGVLAQKLETNGDGRLVRATLVGSGT